MARSRCSTPLLLPATAAFPTPTPVTFYGRHKSSPPTQSKKRDQQWDIISGYFQFKLQEWAQKGMMMNGYDIRDVLREMVNAGEDKLVTANLLHSLGYSDPHVKYLCGPIVSQEAKFNETALMWLAKTIALDRMDLILEETGAGIVGVYATPTEVLAYLHPHPSKDEDRIIWQIGQGERWDRLYIYLSEEIRRQKNNSTLCWELEQPKVVNLSRFDLSRIEAREYLGLASLIRYLVVTRAPHVVSIPTNTYTSHQASRLFENLFRQEKTCY
jgi:hypothetical protein